MTVRIVLPVLLVAIPGLLGAQAEHQHPAEHEHAAPVDQTRRFQPPVEPTADMYMLSELVEIAFESNPTVKQAQAGVDEAEGVRKQAGRYPNPTIGATGDENSANAAVRGGEVGVFVEQRIVTAGKRGLSRDIAAQQKRQAQVVETAQRQRVRNAVGQLFYEMLGAQWELDVYGRIADLTNEAADITRELANVGQADQPDVLSGEIEAQRSLIDLRQAENRAARAWTQLALMTGQPHLERKPLMGDLEKFPVLDREMMREKLLQHSPQIAFAIADVERANLAVERAKVDKWPDIMLHGGFRNSPVVARDGTPIGAEGFFDVGVQIPVFDRRKGAIKAARAGAERAELETTRVKLELASALAERYREYQNATAIAGLLRDEMLPRAVQAHETYRQSFDRMAAAYPQVLIARRNMLELEQEYASALVSVWVSAIEIEGLLLSGGLNAPTAPTGEVDSPDAGSSWMPTALRRHR